MTGEEFEAGMRRLGLTQTRMADLLNCNRATISARCRAEVVETQWRYIMLGMLAEDAVRGLASAVEQDSEKNVK